MNIFNQIAQLKQTLKIIREIRDIPIFLKGFSTLQYKSAKFFKNCNEFIQNTTKIPDAIGFKIKKHNNITIVDAILTNNGLCRKIYNKEHLIKKNRTSKSYS